MARITLGDEPQRALLQAARAARLNAYAPYSNFLVGAAVLDEQGQVHAGCNVENAAYPQGVCAEAAALSAMVLAGGRRATALLVVGEGPAWVTPCGTNTFDCQISASATSTCTPRGPATRSMLPRLTWRATTCGSGRTSAWGMSPSPPTAAT